MSATDFPRSTVSPRSRRFRPLFLTAMFFFVVGVIGVLASIAIPLLSSSNEGPTWVYLIGILCTPLGFVLAIIYALLSGLRPKDERR